MSVRSYWFEAKSYGFGWGLPVSWQGWLTVAAYLVSIFAAAAWIDAATYRFASIVCLTAVLVAVVIWKGERPARWRWGRNREQH